ncbi:MAG: hypothetical protein NC131_09950 [Roseburia sp.]|nr:hypothetical protein [Roseburia sp.]
MNSETRKPRIIGLCGEFQDENVYQEWCKSICNAGDTLVTGFINDHKIIAFCDTIMIVKHASAKGTPLMDIANYAHVIGKPVRFIDVGFLDKRKIALCGSYKFIDKFLEVEKKRTSSGHIVFTPSRFAHIGRGVTFTPEEERAFDDLHREKMSMADKILIINPDGYIGEDTLAEIKWALSKHLEVEYLKRPEEGLIYGEE